MVSGISQMTHSIMIKITIIKETIKEFWDIDQRYWQTRKASKQSRYQPYENKENSKKTQEKETYISITLIFYSEILLNI